MPSMLPPSFAALLLALFTLSGTPASADADWQLRIGGVWFDPSGESRQSLIDGGEAVTSASAEVGLTATAEVRLNERLGIEFGALIVGSSDLTARLDVGPVSTRVRDRFDLHVFGAGLNIHLTPNQKVDVYIGPFIGQAIFSDLIFAVDDDNVRFAIADETLVGGVLGVDVPFAEQWSLNLAARYFDLELDPRDLTGTQADPIDLETLSVSVGVGYRF